ncbi:MAG: efflux RND transporter periplasmic adaptor subunit, partial [Myxococcota bacterium]|nr:efflux RND transporter periplasmic adaptor subunit [Myxococcota bacterium]
LVLLGVAPGDVDRLLEGERAPRTVPLRAPASGHVTRFETALGAYVTPSTLLYEITDLSRVRAVASVFGGEIELAREDVEARFVPRDGGEEIPLELELVEPRVEGDARTARVRFLARNPELALRPGQIGDVVIAGTARDALVVPRDAVIDTGTRRYVYVARPGGLFEPRAVEVGPLRGDSRVILGGLEAGELVVVRGAFVLDSESRLQSALAPATTPATTPAPAAEDAP